MALGFKTWDRGGVTTENEPASINCDVWDRGGLFTYVASGGVETAKTLTANVDVSATVVRDINRTITETLDLTSTVSRDMTKTMSDTVDITGTTARSVGKPITGDVDIGVTSVRDMSRMVNGTVDVDGTVVRDVSKAMTTATIDITGTITKTIVVDYAKTLSAGIDITGSQSQAQGTVTLSDMVYAADRNSIARKVLRKDGV